MELFRLVSGHWYLLYLLTYSNADRFLLPKFRDWNTDT